MEDLKSAFEVIGLRGLQIAAVLFVTIFLGLVTQRLLGRLSRSKHISSVTVGRLITVGRFTTLIIVVLLTLQISGVFAQAWALLSATIAALAVAFVATWSLLSNVTAALLLLAFRPFRIDDEIEILEGEKSLLKGRVADLNLMFTTIISGDVACRVPNNFFLQKVTRVARLGSAPDPGDDTSAPFF